MTYPCHFSLVLHDREEIDSLVDAVIAGRGSEWDCIVQQLPRATVEASRHSCRAYCVQRQARFLGDHTIEENWKLPLWESAADDPIALDWSLAQGRSVFARYSTATASAYPSQLDEVTLLAAQFGQAHVNMPEILILDAVLSGWHRTDQAKVGRMIQDYASRHPFRVLIYVDVTEPPSGILPFLALELESS